MKKQSRDTAYQSLPCEGIDPFLVFAEAKTSHIETESFFFEAASQEADTKGYAVIGFGPFEVLRQRQGRVEFISQGELIIREEPFFKVLEGFLAQQTSSGGSQCRFQNGGIFGCIGYDCIAEIEPRLKKAGYFTRESELGTSAELLIAQRLMVFDYDSDLIHLIDASGDKAQINFMKEVILASRSDSILDSSNEYPEPNSLGPDRLRPQMGREAYCQAVRTLKSHILDGDIFQAVLAECFECELKVSPLQVLDQLRRLSPAPYSFYFDFETSNLLGASPETLVKVLGRSVLTHPIAGTRPRGKNAAEDQIQIRNLRRSPKEAAEHLMLVDLARNDLGRVARPGSVEVTRFRDIQKLSKVLHLVSEVRAELKAGVSALDAFMACFPAGTLSGAPKIRAMEILSDLETQPRSLYGGAVIAFDSFGGLDSCIAIRSLESQGNKAVLRAGAGIVADSRPESEYQEVNDKLSLLREAIGTAEAVELRKLRPGAVS